jgi:hypothetical protein
LGADPADSDTVYTSTPHAVATPLQIYIGGISATILYKGSAGYPGVNQINLTIPPNVADGCWISLAAVAGGVADGQFFVPPYILSALPAGNGGTEIQNNLYEPLTATGLDIGLLLGVISISADSTFR